MSDRATPLHSTTPATVAVGRCSSTGGRYRNLPSVWFFLNRREDGHPQPKGEAMSRSVNKIILIGRIRDPIPTSTSRGQA